MSTKIFEAFEGLNQKRQRHSVGCLTLAGIVCSEHKDLMKHKDDLCALAILHDIGYSGMISESGYHQIDGARFLRKEGFNENIVCAVARHSEAEKLVGGDIDAFNKEFVINSSEKALYLDVIDLLDSHVDANGEGCTLQQRYNDIVLRFGGTSAQAKVFFDSMPRLMALESKFEYRMI